MGAIAGQSNNIVDKSAFIPLPQRGLAAVEADLVRAAGLVRLHDRRPRRAGGPAGNERRQPGIGGARADVVVPRARGVSQQPTAPSAAGRQSRLDKPGSEP